MGEIKNLYTKKCFGKIRFFFEKSKNSKLPNVSFRYGQKQTVV